MQKPHHFKNAWGDCFCCQHSPFQKKGRAHAAAHVTPFLVANFSVVCQPPVSRLVIRVFPLPASLRISPTRNSYNRTLAVPLSQIKVLAHLHCTQCSYDYIVHNYVGRYNHKNIKFFLFISAIVLFLISNIVPRNISLALYYYCYF